MIPVLIAHYIKKEENKCSIYSKAVFDAINEGAAGNKIEESSKEVIKELEKQILAYDLKKERNAGGVEQLMVKSLVEMNLDDVGKLCADRHQEYIDKTDWETKCLFYDSYEKICILQGRPFGWATRINEMESLEKLYKNMKGK